MNRSCRTIDTIVAKRTALSRIIFLIQIINKMKAFNQRLPLECTSENTFRTERTNIGVVCKQSCLPKRKRQKNWREANRQKKCQMHKAD